MNLGLQNKKAIILAASKGLGKAAVLAKEGCALAICACSAETLQQTAEAIQKEIGVKVFAKTVDVHEKEGLSYFLQESITALQGVDILMTNAGAFL